MVTVEVPEYKVREEVEMKPAQSALVVVDMQKDFVDDVGALLVPGARKTVPQIKRLVDAFHARGMLVVYTQDSHQEGDPEFDIWGRHVVEGSAGEEIVDDLRPREGDVIVKKPRYDAFYGTNLDHRLKTKGIDTLIVVGTVANI